MSSSVLADRDINAAAQQPAHANAKPDVKSMEYHRQVLQSKLEESQYVSSLPESQAPILFHFQMEGQWLTITPAGANKHTSRHPTPSCRLALQS
jgi:hypothetical protein